MERQARNESLQKAVPAREFMVLLFLLADAQSVAAIDLHTRRVCSSARFISSARESIWSSYTAHKETAEVTPG